MADADDDLAAIVCSRKVGSVVAAAGCGKTEQIVKATSHCEGRHLILTHTHAGVDALRKRLKENGVSSLRYGIDTIAGWCLRYAASFPARSGLRISEPRDDRDWAAVYHAALELLTSGAITRVLRISYCGVFVDEYQDCGDLQHQVISTLASILPVCVFGDPLQAIFDFNGQAPVDWQRSVFPRFPLIRTLVEPHRWVKHGNIDLANWLKEVRSTLDAGRSLDLGASQLPGCVTWEWLPDRPGPRQQKIVRACLSSMSLDGELVIIGDAKNLNGRALLAKKLAKQGFSNIEPIDCKSVYAAGNKLQSTVGANRFAATLDFLEQCMSGVERAAFESALISRKAGRRQGTAKFGSLVDLGIALHDSTEQFDACLALIEAFDQRPTTKVFRREMLSVMRSALKVTIADEGADLAEAIWQVQNKTRHAGRRIPFRSVGSTLLVKGLEFANVIVVHSPNMSRKDWYVALTRATHTVKILSPQRRFLPQA